MLQFELSPRSRYSLADQARLAVEGGCGWIVIPAGDSTDEALIEEARPIADICRGSEVILTIADRPEVTRELGIHGVYLTAASGLSPFKVRQDLGAEAIIGVEAAAADSIRALEKMDIDYAVLAPTLSIEACEEIIAAVRGAGGLIPIVMAYPPDMAAASEMMAHGASGVLVSAPIADADSPAEATREYIKCLSKE